MENNPGLAQDLNRLCKETLVSHLGIEFMEVSEGRVVARMPVDHRTRQPQNILHGGASLALAETVGSAGSYIMVDREKYNVVGLEINANHVESVSSGYVLATARIIHQGKKTHVWEVKITDESGKLVSVCRITNMVVKIKEDK